MKNKIVVVEATSTAFNYLEDIRALGYEPVILEACRIRTPEESIW